MFHRPYSFVLSGNVPKTVGDNIFWFCHPLNRVLILSVIFVHFLFNCKKKIPFYVDLTKERAQRKSSLFLCQVMRKIRRSRQRVAAGQGSRIHQHVVTTKYLFFYTTTPHFVHSFFPRRGIISPAFQRNALPVNPDKRNVVERSLATICRTDNRDTLMG